ncbi:hypothetical protein BC832DRAFT_18647 [Gaertneriomyces semiglobifer]|nr:hypothetical protein BC832DRAFT_18647 [Gaertneriomyces semiglobifer]
MTGAASALSDPQMASLPAEGRPYQAAVDACTQTEQSVEDQDTLNITIPHSHLSFVHIEESVKGGRENKRMSAIIVASSPTSEKSKDDISVLSINIPSRYSYISSTEKPLPGVPDSKRTSLLSQMAGEGVISIDVATSPRHSHLPARLSKSQELEHRQDVPADDMAPAPAYEEAVQPLRHQSSVLTLVDDSVSDASSKSFLQTSVSPVRPTTSPLRLPPLGITDYITNPDAEAALRSLSASWPVHKSGLLVRKELPASQGRLNADRSSKSRLMGKTFNQLWKGKKKPRSGDSGRISQGDDDEWALFYAEVRGSYLMFYYIEPPTVSGTSPTSRPPSVSMPLTNSHSLVRNHGSLGNSGFRESVMHKSVKLFSTLTSRKSRSSHSRKPSSELAGKLFRSERSSGEDKRRMSNERQRTLLAHLSPEDIRTAPRTLVHYIPLHRAMVEVVNQPASNTLTTPGYTASYATTDSAVGACQMVLTTALIDHSVTDRSNCDQIFMDIVLHEDIFDHSSMNEISASTVGSMSPIRDADLRRQELNEWVNAIRNSSEVAVGHSVAPSLRSMTRERSFSSPVAPVEFNPTFRSMPSKQSLSVERHPDDATTRISRDTASVKSKSSFGFPPLPTQGASSSRFATFDRRPSVEPMGTTTEGLMSSSASSSGGKSFAKMISSRWKSAFEKEKDASRHRPVISGPTNFTKVDVSPDMLLQSAAGFGSSPVSSSSTEVKPAITAGSKDLSPSSSESSLSKEHRRRAKLEKAASKQLVTKTKNKDGEEAADRSKRPAGRREKDADKEKEKHSARAKKAQKAPNGHSTISAPVSLSHSSTPNQTHPLQKPNAYNTKDEQQPTMSSSRLFFPFFTKNLFPQKERDVAPAILPVTERLQRSTTVSSRASTMRRRVGRSRPQSATTMSSDRGTIGSGIKVMEGKVPIAIRECIALVEEIGLTTEGLYRISGSAASVERLRRLLMLDPTCVQLTSTPTSPLAKTLPAAPIVELVAAAERLPSISRRTSRLSMTDTVSSARSSADFTHIIESRRTSHNRRLSAGSAAPAAALSGPSLYDNDVHVVTGVIKSFLREGLGSKKVPICTFNLYEGFITATQIADWRARMIAIQDLVHSLPPNHFATLKLVCEHLNRVASESDKNRMSVRNLSIIFGPTLLRPPPALDSLARMVEDMPFQCTAVETLIEQSEWVFGPIEFEETELPAEEVNGESAPSASTESAQSEDHVHTVHAGAHAEGSRETVSGEEDGDDDVASNCGVVGSEMGSDVGAVNQVVDSSMPAQVEPSSSIEALPSSSTANESPKETVGEQAAAPVPLTGPRLKHTHSKMMRRQGQLLPLIYFDDLRDSGRLDMSAIGLSIDTTIPPASSTMETTTATALTGSSRSGSGSAEESFSFGSSLPSPSLSVSSSMSHKTHTNKVTPSEPATVSYIIPPAPRLSLNLETETRSFLNI